MGLGNPLLPKGEEASKGHRLGPGPSSELGGGMEGEPQCTRPRQAGDRVGKGGQVSNQGRVEIRTRYTHYGTEDFS